MPKKEIAIDAYLYPNGTAVVEKHKRKRGRPPKRVSKPGLTIHQEPLSSKTKMLTAQQRSEIRRDYKMLVLKGKKSGLKAIVEKLAKQYDICYKQCHDLVASL